MDIFDYAALDRLAEANASVFRNASPFPHISFDNFVPVEVLDEVLREFGKPDEHWTQWKHFNQKKQGLKDTSRMGPTTRALIAEMNGPRFAAFVEKLTGIGPLITDPTLDGGGIQETSRGGHLNLHTDFQAHTLDARLAREINFLVYLNRDWKDEYGGHLELWDPVTRTKQASIAPVFNRVALFHTTATSLHGYPDPLQCPAEMSRKSIALWYYRDEGRALPVQPTGYHARPGESLTKRALIGLDNMAVGGYSLLKRHTPINDALVSKVLKYFR